MTAKSFVRNMRIAFSSMASFLSGGVLMTVLLGFGVITGNAWTITTCALIAIGTAAMIAVFSLIIRGASIAPKDLTPSE